MNKAHYQSMFGTTTGTVYRFVGEIPEGQDSTSVVTEKFIQAVGTDLVSIVVVDTKNMFLVYTTSTEIFEHADFALITDLAPDLITETPVVPEELPPEVQ